MRYGAVKSACIAIEIPKLAIPGNPSNDALVCFVAGIDAHAEKASMRVVKQKAICKRDVNGGLGFGVGC